MEDVTHAPPFPWSAWCFLLCEVGPAVYANVMVATNLEYRLLGRADSTVVVLLWGSGFIEVYRA